MNNISTFLRESKTARFLIPCGIAMLVFGIVMYIINSKNQNYIETEATVFDVVLVEEAHTDANGDMIEASYDVSVKYTANDNEYEGLLSGVGKYNIGDKITIYYNPDDPKQITQTISLVFPLVLAGVGVAAIVGGVISGANAIKKHKALKEQEKGWTNE